ncbi:MAG: YkgJ family cysteine cluster protein [Pseudodesulfovibrio sp.]|nr:YkgJ family cysteine cluster protein [Pseudodesulfovibrio sp.]
MQNQEANTQRCSRCGDCCRNGGPALHDEDLPLIQDGTIPLTSIVTLRPGERAYDQPAQKIMPLDSEILKIKGRDGKWTCIFYSPEGHACGVYNTRPIECKVLFCRDIEPLANMYNKGRLTRADLLPEGHPLLELIAEHDEKCGPMRMEELGMAARQGDAEAGKALQEMVIFDMEIRRLVPEKAGMPPEMTDFLFGRPLRVLLRAMNINTYEVGGSIRFGFQA